MAYASLSGRARTNARAPQAHAICDRCGFRYNWVDLQWQYEWRGPVIQNIRILVCKPCLDVPQENVRSIVVPADPVPIINARPQDFVDAESDFRAVSLQVVLDPITGLPQPQNDLRVTEDCQNRVIQPFGQNDGLNANAVMPLALNQGVPTEYGIPLSLLSVIGNGTATVTVTCSKVHNLQPNAQVSVEGLSVSSACGFYSVTPITATAFTYQTFGATPQASLLTPTSRIITATIGLPIGFDTVPKINGPALDPGTLVGFSNESGSGQFVLEDGVTYLGQE